MSRLAGGLDSKYRLTIKVYKNVILFFEQNKSFLPQKLTNSGYAQETQEKHGCGEETNNPLYSLRLMGRVAATGTR